jgi:protein N-terminal glutamine amidohydrolase
MGLVERVEELLDSRRKLNCSNNHGEGGDEDGGFRQRTFLYASHYCEENIYKLVEEIMANSLLEGCNPYAIFISSSNKSTPIWNQKLGNPVCWDYHVILCIKSDEGEAVILDFDTMLPFPSRATEYVDQSFHPDISLRPQYQQ